MSIFQIDNCPLDKATESLKLNIKYQIGHGTSLSLDHTKNLEEQYRIAVDDIDDWNNGGLALWRLQKEGRQISDKLRVIIKKRAAELRNLEQGPLYAVCFITNDQGNELIFLLHGERPGNPNVSLITDLIKD